MTTDLKPATWRDIWDWADDQGYTLDMLRDPKQAREIVFTFARIEGYNYQTLMVFEVGALADRLSQEARIHSY